MLNWLQMLKKKILKKNFQTLVLYRLLRLKNNIAFNYFNTDMEISYLQYICLYSVIDNIEIKINFLAGSLHNFIILDFSYAFYLQVLTWVPYSDFLYSLFSTL